VAVTVSREVAAALQRGATVVLLARSQGSPEALPGALAGVAWPPGLTHVSRPAPVPGGAVVLLDLGAAPTEQIPASMARALEAAGLGDAVIEAPPVIGDRYAMAQAYGPAARSWLRGPLSRVPSAGWLLDVAGVWLREHGPPTAVIISVEAPVAWPEVRPLADAVLAAGHSVTFTAGDLSAGVTAAAVGHGYALAPEATLTTARPSGEKAADALLEQREVLRSGASRLVWAGAAPTRTAGDFLLPRWTADEPGGRPDVTLLGDLAVPDALWYQILSPGHLDRLGGPPPDAVELPDGRFELTLGEPEEWLPECPDRLLLQAKGRELLAPCLLTPDEAFTLSRERLHAVRDQR
jgi:hypothetical protein